jgi:hypothetical protein
LAVDWAFVRRHIRLCVGHVDGDVCGHVYVHGHVDGDVDGDVYDHVYGQGRVQWRVRGSGSRYLTSARFRRCRRNVRCGRNVGPSTIDCRNTAEIGAAGVARCTWGGVIAAALAPVAFGLVAGEEQAEWKDIVDSQIHGLPHQVKE